MENLNNSTVDNKIIKDQIWLEDKYEIDKSFKKHLYISNKEFIGSLDLREFTNLETLNCSHN